MKKLGILLLALFAFSMVPRINFTKSLSDHYMAYGSRHMDFDSFDDPGYRKHKMSQHDRKKHETMFYNATPEQQRGMAKIESEFRKKWDQQRLAFKMKYTDLKYEMILLEIDMAQAQKTNDQAAVKELINKLKAKDQEYQKLKLEEKSMRLNLETEKNQQVNTLLK
ncbi:hypothetical protein SAMN02745150_00880 [Brevinema andersonii]|uniref:LTXXQ motif family protein n=1 Tax=Brevinema andersonii TaxID=34097 RepID=A0A1I1E7B8_BREAD|nr:hypothetical protein [Brevinema andersonii]SFB80843.1 hypothetical protein SAMN02745150_00880 [Brevinema andersonii]